jgi:hypothetical protein
VETVQASQNGAKLAGGPTAGFGCASGGGECGVDRVDLQISRASEKKKKKNTTAASTPQALIDDSACFKNIKKRTSMDR